MYIEWLESSVMSKGPSVALHVVVPNRATFEYSYFLSSVRTNRATVFL